MTQNLFEKWNMLSGLNYGDKVQLTDGSVAEFVKLAQKNFTGIIDGKSYNIPIQMAVEVVGQAESKDDEIANLKKGQPFYINKGGKALLFYFEGNQGGRILGVDPVSRAVTRIDKQLYVSKVEGI